MSDTSKLKELEDKRMGVFGMMAGSTNPRTGKLVTAEPETLRLIELVNDYGDVISQLEAAQKRIAEQEANDRISQQVRDEILARAIEAEEELARRDALEPVAYYANDAYYNTERAALKDGAEEVIPLYEAATVAILPREIKAEPEKYDVIDHGFIDGYNKAIADVVIRLDSAGIKWRAAE